MKKLYFLVSLMFIGFLSIAKENNWPTNPYKSDFDFAYSNNSNLPKGILEAISFSQTRFYNLKTENQNSCIDIPKSIGVMGLCFDGKNYFRENGKLISQLNNNINIEKADIKQQLNAYANAFSKLSNQLNINSDKIENYIPVLVALSELPNKEDIQNNFALNSYLYQIFWLLNEPAFQINYHTPKYNINLRKVFGEENYRVLSASKVTINNESIYNQYGERYTVNNSIFSADYAPALWNAAATCNYSSRSGTAISAVTIHDVEGTYAGCISWFKNCNASVSAHYVLRSSDGQITQMVLEADKAWHVGSANPYAIGLEHEGYRDVVGWYTTAMYNSSADLVRDICNSGYGINPLRTYNGPSCNDICTLGNCVKIKGHQHFPSQTHNDPGPNWDWYLYYRLVNNNPSVTTYTTLNGNFYDSGGASGDYNDDERSLYLINPPNASSLTVTFNSFNLETNWDYLYIYDGVSTNAPLIGRYTGTSGPGTITASSGALLFDFRSDCATTSPGWEATWNATVPAAPAPPDSINPYTAVSTPNNWVSSDFAATFSDSDNTGGSGLEKSFYQVLEYNGYEYRANNSNGFFSDNFDSIIHPDWTTKAGSWQIENGYLRQSDTNLTNTNIYAYLRQDLSNRYLYNWAQKFGGVNYSGANRRAGFHIMADAPDSTNRGNSYFVWFRLDQDKIQIYKVVNNSWGASPVVDTAFTFNPNYWYDVKVVFDRILGKMWVYIDNQLSATYTDNTPHQTGNYISFRTGNSDYMINNLKIYRSRYSNQATNIKVGPASTNDIRYQNIDPATPAGRVKSINMDSTANLSGVAYKDINVDWTAPIAPTVINDGEYFDKDSTSIDTVLAGNWNASSDPNSGFKRFWYSFGTSAGDSDVIGWTDHWIYDTVYVDSVSLVAGQLYYLNLRAENNAGLISNTVSSDGVLIVSPLSLKAILNSDVAIFPTIIKNHFYLLNNSSESISVKLYDNNGKLVLTQNNLNPGFSGKVNITETLSSGIYYAKVFNKKSEIKTVKLIIE